MTKLSRSIVELDPVYIINGNFGAVGWRYVVVQILPDKRDEWRDIGRCVMSDEWGKYNAQEASTRPI